MKLRNLAAATFAAGALAALSGAAFAADKVTFLTSWYAQAEHGGFYQAKASGLYEKAGLDVTIKMGGPQVNGMQLLLAGETDLMMGYDFQVLKSLEQNFPVTTVAASFQFDLQGMMTHEDVTGLGDLKGKTILIATSGRSTWWPWLKGRFGYTEDQAKPYTFNLQPFFADKNTAQQGYPSSEPFQAMKQGVPAKFFIFAKDGYPPYGTTMVVDQGVPGQEPGRGGPLRQGLAPGLGRLPEEPGGGEPAHQGGQPQDGRRADRLRGEVDEREQGRDGGDAAHHGVGIMTEARWKATYDYMVGAGLLKPGVDWKAAYTDRFVKDLKVGM